ncbi:enoyl-CoA hydratase-related protein [Novosphingobium colocasiae]
MTQPFEHILYEVVDGVATLTLNRPDVFNAMGAAMLDEILTALDLVDADDGVGAVIITGAGKGFCGGADLSRGKAAFDKEGDGKQTPSVPVLADGSIDYSTEAARDGGGRLALRIFLRASSR